MSDVFVSYKAEDRRRVKPLVEALEADGYSVWWDEQIGGGAQWRHMIEAELNAAKCVIVAWSKRSVGPDGTFVQDEATRAQQRHVYIPVLIDKVHLPLGFGEMQALPLSGWKGDRFDPRYQAILAAVNRIAGDSARAGGPAPMSPPQTGIDRRTVVAGGAVATAAVVGIGGWALLKPGAAGASADSIAVLPFANLSGDPAQAYFSDGIAEELRSALARVAGLKVVGRTSSEAVRNDDAETAAKKLGVDSILTGSVRQSPSTIRVGAQLVDGRSGLEKWSENYDRPPGDAIKIQTDIAENVATALSAEFGRAAREVVAIGGTNNAAAQDLFLKAKAELHADDSESSLRKSAGLLDSAIGLDPKFADAYALKARALADLVGYYTSGGGFAGGFSQSEALARQAVSLAPKLAAGHMVLAYILLSQLNVAPAAEEYERGHSLSRNDSGDLIDYGRFLAKLDRNDAALEVARQAQARDPLNPSAFSLEGNALSNAQRNSEALAAYRKAVELAPDRLLDRAAVGLALTEMGRQDEALEQLAKLPPGYLFRLIGEAVIYARKGDRAASDSAFRRARQGYGDAANYQYAEVHAQLGEKDQAFAALDRAWDFRDPGLVSIKSDRWLDPLRNDPRYSVLLGKMNFPA